MAKEFFTAIIASGGLAGEYFDIAAGPANPDVIDVLLSVGDGSLAKNAPLVLASTGALGAPRTLDLINVEQNGRIFSLSVRNTDLATNSLFVVGTTTVNGFGPTTGLEINELRDYIFFHESGGIWRAYEQGLTGTGTTRGFNYRYSINNGVPGGGTRYLETQAGVVTSSVGDRLIANADLTGVSYELDTVPINTYRLDILEDPAGTPTILTSITVSPGIIGGEFTIAPISLLSGETIGARLIRTVGSGFSNFRDVNVSIRLE